MRAELLGIVVVLAAEALLLLKVCKRHQDLGLRAQGLRRRAWGLGFRVSKSQDTSSSFAVLGQRPHPTEAKVTGSLQKPETPK